MKNITSKITKEFAKELVEKAKQSISFQQILEKSKNDYLATNLAK